MIDLTTSQLPRTSWVVAAVASASKLAGQKSLSPDEAKRYERYIVGLSCSMSWLRVARKDVSELSVELLVEAFEIVDRYVSEKLDAPVFSTSARGAMSFRKLLYDYASAINIDKLPSLRNMYRSPHLPVNIARPLISDSFISDEDKRHPIGAIPFDTSEQYRAKASAKVASTLLMIEAAALRDLDDHEEKHCWYERTLGSIDVCEVLLKKVQNFCRSKHIQKSQTPLWFKEIPTIYLAAIYYQICCKTSSRDAAGKFFLYCPREREILSWLASQGRRVYGPQRLVDEFLGKRLLTMKLLHSCLIILQKNTGWNVNSVLEMNAKMIEDNGKGGFLIQGYKSRTAESTPFFEILASEKIPIRAIKYLLERMQLLKSLRWLDGDESRLWVNHRSILDGRARQYVGWEPLQKMFCERHAFPHFSAEQIRVEVLASHGLLRGGIEAARHVAGHSEYKTVAGYLDRLLMQRMNSAYALEFERRLEASVRYRMGTEENFNSEKDLLYTVGNGVSCADPFKPPDPAFLIHAVCNGNGCNQGEGCVNRRVEINPDRMEEIARSRLMYINGWRDMLNKNSEYFMRVHVPNMLVNFALVSILERSAYRSMFKKIAEGIGDE